MHFLVPKTILVWCKLVCKCHHQVKISVRSSSNMASPWKESSSIIIVAKSALYETVGTNLSDILMRTAKTSIEVQQKFDYRLLMLKRHANSSFMANAFVFPGGMVELSDYSLKWWDVFSNAGFNKEHLLQLPRSILGPRPPMCTDSVTLANANLSAQDHFPPELALRICAIREAFEETGILLLTSFDSQDKSPLFCAPFEMDMEVWRKKISKDSSAFIDFCLSANLCPHIWCLHEWWDWLTPSIGHRRFDTMFYVCCLPKVPEVKLSETEISALKWLPPDEILKEMTTGNLLLPPPQAYEVSRFCNFHHYQDFKNFAKQRESKGVVRWMNVISLVADGAIAVLPGDDLYPEDTDPKALFNSPKYSQSRLYLRNATRNLNRIEIEGQVMKIFCNAVPPCGHMQPLSHSSKSHMAHSHL